MYMYTFLLLSLEYVIFQNLPRLLHSGIEIKLFEHNIVLFDMTRTSCYISWIEFHEQLHTSVCVRYVRYVWFDTVSKHVIRVRYSTRHWHFRQIQREFSILKFEHHFDILYIYRMDHANKHYVKMLSFFFLINGKRSISLNINYYYKITLQKTNLLLT